MKPVAGTLGSHGLEGHSLHDVRRILAGLAMDLDFVAENAPGLESMLVSSDPARTVECLPLETEPAVARVVPGDPEPGFAAFIDGSQRSAVAAYSHGIPIIHGSVGAVIRQRLDARQATWACDVERRVYLPFVRLPEIARYGGRLQMTAVDTSCPDNHSSSTGWHPLDLSQRAYHMIQNDRERLEYRLAERWCASRTDPLFVDGGISGSGSLSLAPNAVGVIKAHRTLYCEGTALANVLSLRAGERSPMFVVRSGGRAAVASWYLRLRREAGRDPLWGLVRVEVCMAGITPARSDQVSRWILAESAPLSLPDGRWDRMVYGIRDCEIFLDAIL